MPGDAKVRALTGIDGGTLREWRRSRGWDVPKTARELRRVANEPVAAPDALVRMIRSWERGDHELSERYELLYRRLGLKAARPPAREPEPDHAPDDASSVTAWVAATNTTDDAIEEIDRAATYLAEVHAQIPARKVLGEVLALNRDVHTLLRSGRQRLRQTRRLLQIHSRLMAHACVLLGDLGRAQAAREYGTAALLLAQEAEADEAIAWSVQAKTARWTGGFVEAAEFARRGFEVSGPTPTRVELAYREANAIALFGDAPRARKALEQAERAAESAEHRHAQAPQSGRSRLAGRPCSPSRSPSTPATPPARCAPPQQRKLAGAAEPRRRWLPGPRSGPAPRWPT